MAAILAVIIFVAMFVLIVTEKIERHIATLGCGLLTLVLVFGFAMRDTNAMIEVLNFKEIFTTNFWYAASEGESAGTGINWATIFFIGGMMVMVEGMGDSGFFRWLCLRIAKAVHYKVTSIFMMFMLMSFVLAMFIDSITVILFLAAVTVELAQWLKFNPIPLVLSEIFCANLGGSATMCGDPPNIIIGTSLGYTFFDFLLNTGLIAAISLVLVLAYFYLVFRKQLVSTEAVDVSTFPDPKEAITSKKGFTISCIIFACAVVLLVTHAMTGLTVATIGIGIAIVTLIANYHIAGELLKKVDWKTLAFFVGLFVVVGGLEKTGILELIANFIGEVSGGNLYAMVAIIIWISAIASAFIDNIPFAATMIPVIKALAASQGIDLSILSWTLAMGTDIGGSATPIGASANVVGTAVVAKNGYPVGWGKYCRYMAPATVIVIVVSMGCIFLRYL